MNRDGFAAVCANRYIAEQRHAIELTIEILFANVTRCAVYDRPVIPHNEIVALSFEAEGEVRPDRMLPKNLQYLFTFAR